MNTGTTMDTMGKKIKTGEEEEVIRSRGCDSVVPDLPLDVMWDVFTRLPIRKLFQCLCVSKVWRSILRSHQFIEAYRSSNSCCLLLSLPVLHRDEAFEIASGHRIDYCPLLVSSAPAPSEPSPQQFVNLFSVSFVDKEPSNNIPLRRSCREVTRVVNGLFCYSYCEDQLFLCNVFTSQSMRLPVPATRPVDVGFSSSPPAYYLGFDPIKGLYKLLMKRTIGRWISDDYDCRVRFEILTLGTDSSWRGLGPDYLWIELGTDYSWRDLRSGGLVPRFLVTGITHDVICVNGVLYWTDRFDVYSFDLSKEKFGNSVRLPLSEPTKYPSCLVQDGGRPCVLFWDKGNTFLLVIGDDEICNIHTLSLPKELQGVDDFTFLPVGNLPSGEILLAIQTSDSSSAPVYAYDHKWVKHERNVIGKLPPKTGKLQSIVIGKLPRSYLGLKIYATYVSCQEQNIAPLEAIIRGDGV